MKNTRLDTDDDLLVLSIGTAQGRAMRALLIASSEVIA